MPCYRCGVRQVDPVRGHSPWQRGVRDEQQVLICPDCQATADWKSELDSCQRCGGVRLVRRLGEVECRDCEFVIPPEEPAPGGPISAGPAPSGTSAGVEAPRRAGHAHAAGAAGGVRAPGLAEEVAQALERVLGRAGRPPARVRLPAEGAGAKRCARMGGPPQA